MSDTVNISDLVAVLCGFRPEQAHEQFVALATFGAWLHWPEGPKLVEEARAAAGALVIRNLLEGKVQPINSIASDIDDLMRRYLTPKVIADVLLDRAYMQDPFFVEYAVLEDEHKIACATADFLVRAPRLPLPSLNRGRFFIAKGGFAPPFAKSEICHPCSVSTAKKAWFHYGIVSPFLLSARLCKIPLVDLAPDADGAFPKLTRFCDRALMQSFFALASSIQRQLVVSLTNAESKLAFVDLPGELQDGILDLKEFSPQQLKLLRSYNVADAAKIRLR